MEGGFVPFPIFRLPNVIQRELIPYFDSLEQIDISLCSKKCRSLIKSIVTSDGRTITTNFLYQYFDVEIEHPIDNYQCGTFEMAEEYNNILDNNEKPIVNDDSLENNHKWAMVWTDYISDTINCPIGCIFLGIDYKTNGHLQEILNWIAKNCQKSIPHIELGQNLQFQNIIENDEYSFFLDNIKVTDILRIRVKNHPNFQHNLNIKTKNLYLGHAEWLTMSNLLNLVDCTKIELEYSNFTNEELNLFLKQWIDNVLPNLCYFSTEIKNPNFQSIISGVEVTARGLNTVYKSISIVGDSNIFRVGHDIQRIDGLIATILILPHNNWLECIRPVHEEGSMVFRMVETSQLIQMN